MAFKALEARLLAWLPPRLAARLRRADAANKAAVRGMFWVAVFVSGAKGIAALKEVAVAWRYGTAEVLDGYLLVFHLLDWPISLLFSAMVYVLVPELVRRSAGDATDSAQWQRQITTWVWGAAIALTLLLALMLPAVIARGWLGLTEPAREAAMQALPVLALMVGLGIVAAWHACQLMSRQRHVNTFLEGMPALGILVAVLLVPQNGVQPLVWGTVVGFALQALLMAWAARWSGFPIAPSAQLGRPLHGALGVNMGWLLAATFIWGLAGVVDQIILAHLSAGSLAAFGYANRVIALVLTLSATVLGRALLPVFCGVLEDERRYQLARAWARRAFWGGAAAAVLLAVCADWIVAVLFERGAFGPDEGEHVAMLLRWMCLQLPLYAMVTVWGHWMLTHPGHGRTLFGTALAGTAAKVTVTLAALAWTPLQAEAVCLGLTAATLASWLVLKERGRRCIHL